MALQSLRFPDTLQDGGPSQGMHLSGKDEIALMEAALMASPQVAMNGPRRRKRTKYNTWQKNLLEKAYSLCKYPNVWTRETLSKALNVDDARIIVWFQNRRARYSRQSAAGRQRGRPSAGDALEAQLPAAGTVHYASPVPAQGPCDGVRRPLADALHGPNALPPAGCPPALQGLKLECDAASCAAGPGMSSAYGHWYIQAGGPSAGPSARYPVDEIEVDFTVADFTMDLDNQYLLDLSHSL
ncbi:uncharacterized protein [Scyliorhinus torazame]|uniref:uncharacterized protein n=1 Tax=Scyliorhinus torazame TaxID=75743 RepID=UPI003B5991D0